MTVDYKEKFLSLGDVEESHSYEQESRYAKLPRHLQESIQSLDALNAEEIPEVAWIVPDLLTEGFTILAGYLKSGKSYLILNVGVAIAEGGLVLGATKVEQGRVLYITPDDRQKARIRARIRKMRLGNTSSIPLDVVTEWANLDEGGIEDIRAYLDVFPETKLVIIDVLMNVLPGIKEDGNTYSELYLKLPPLKNLAQEKHVAIVAVMHTNKTGSRNGNNPRSAIYGSQAYGAIADSLLIIDENFDTHQRFLMTYGKDHEEKRFAMEFEANTGRYTYGEERKMQLQEISASRTIEARVNEFPGSTYSQLVKWLISEQGLKEVTAQARVTRAGKEGRICTELGKTGYYPCTDKTSRTDEEDSD